MIRACCNKCGVGDELYIGYVPDDEVSGRYLLHRYWLFDFLTKKFIPVYFEEVTNILPNAIPESYLSETIERDRSTIIQCFNCREFSLHLEWAGFWS